MVLLLLLELEKFSAFSVLFSFVIVLRRNMCSVRYQWIVTG